MTKNRQLDIVEVADFMASLLVLVFVADLIQFLSVFRCVSAVISRVLLMKARSASMLNTAETCESLSVSRRYVSLTSGVV